MQWFADAKLGIFIHWGIYSVNGIEESWSFHNKLISYPKYMQQINGFTASQYNPAQWADLIKKSGAKYAVITTKHHDGVALYDTRQNDLSVVKKSPVGKDVITPFVNELRKNNIKVGTYFSLIDWSDNNYPRFLKDSVRYKISDDKKRWQKFQQFFQNQINEISTQFNPDLFWFDGDWEHTAKEWQAEKIRAAILANNPKAIINSRLQGYGDYETPEQNFPITRPDFKYWELCMTTNNSWGYQSKDTAYKSVDEIISIFTDCIGNGGNLLLAIGPKEDGTFPEQQTTILTELGSWIAKNNEAIYGTIAGLPLGHFYGASTLSKDSSVIYLFVPGKNAGGDIVVKGLDCKIKKVSVLDNDELLQNKIVGKIWWSKVPGLVFIKMPDKPEERMSVVKIELAGKLKLYNGKGGY
jgi:alpha-L-fucosidase